jgi:HK97 gp10 family phage protein
MVRAQIEIANSKLGTLGGKIRRRAAQVVKEAANDCAVRAKSSAPVDTGALRAEIHVEEKSELASDTVSAMPYSLYQEYGTRYMAAQPYMTPAAESVRPRFLGRMADVAEAAARE